MLAHGRGRLPGRVAFLGAGWIADKHDALDDPEFRAIYLACDAAFHWFSDDPRLDALAKRIQRWSAKRSSQGGAGAVQAPAIAQQVTISAGTPSPAWERLTEIGKQLEAGG